MYGIGLIYKKYICSIIEKYKTQMKALTKML